MKKILLISHEMSLTGAPNSLLRQAIYLKENNYQVDIWSLKGGDLMDAYRKAGFNPVIIHKNSYYGFKQFWNKNKKDYDLILCNTTNTYKCVDVLHNYNIPLIWFIRETQLIHDNMEHNFGFAKLFSNFYNLYTVSDYSASIITNYNSNCKIINNAVPDYFTSFKKFSNHLVFGYIGSIIPSKGIEELLEAFKLALESNKNLSLIIAGDYNNKYAQKLKTEYQNIKQINWIGSVAKSTKEDFFNNIDVLVAPSWDEAFGLTIIEGCMYGKVVITTRNVGAKYLIEENKSGIIVEPKNSLALSQALVNLAQMDINHLEKMQKYSRDNYLKYGTVDTERKNVIKMVEDNLNNPPPPPLYKTNYTFEASTSFYGKHTKFYCFGYHLLSIPQKIFYINKRLDGKAEIYLFGKKVFSYKYSLPFNTSVIFKYKYIHIMNNDKFNKPFVDFLNRNFNKDEHLVLFKKMHDFPVPVGDNVIQFINFNQLNLNRCNAEKIIFHSLIGDSVSYLYKHKNILKKSYWMIWGADLYNACRNKENDFVRKNFRGYISDTDGDCEVAVHKYNSKCETYRAGYTFPITIDMIKSAKKIPHNFIKIQINNSSDDSTLEMLKTLSKFRKENIKISTILSYGKLEYKDSIISKGKKIFGNNFEYTDAIMSPDKYAQHIAQNDILILNQNRQQGLGNCFAHLYLGAKVFIRSEVTTYNHFNSKNIKIFDTNEIKNMDFEKFVNYPRDIADNNSKGAEIFFDDTYLKKLWNKVFE